MLREREYLIFLSHHELSTRLGACIAMLQNLLFVNNILEQAPEESVEGVDR